MSKLSSTLLVLFLAAAACTKDPSPRYHYFEVGINANDFHAQKVDTNDWRDTSYIVATADSQLIRLAQEQLKLPVADRKLVNGALQRGNGGYNRNGPHTFKWHIKENDWQLADMSAELLDGRAYSDVDKHLNYWVDTVKRLAPWNSYIKREIKD